MLFNKFWPTFFLVLVLSIIITTLTFKDKQNEATSKLNAECSSIDDFPEQK